MTETVGSIEGYIQEMTVNLGRLRIRHSDTAAAIDEIADCVRRGDCARANEVASLIGEQDALAARIAAHEQELEQSTAKLAQLKTAANKAELHALFSRMEQKRQRIIELGRTMALLLGELQGTDRFEGSKLVPKHFGSLDQQRFVQLLEPVNIYADRAWTDGVRDVPGLDYAHVVRVRPVTKL